MKLSVIIPTYKRNELLEKCLKHLSPEFQTLDRKHYEVIVTDDDDDLGGKVFIDKNFSWVRWVEGPHKGPGANRNNGARYAEGDWLILIDDDCIPDKAILESYFDAIRNNKSTRAFEGKIIADRPQKRYDEESPVNLTGGYFWTCNVAIEKSLFFDVGGFDEGFHAAMEDVDLHLRLKKMTSIKFLKEAVVVHPWRRAVPSMHKKRYECLVYFMAKHNIKKDSKYRVEGTKTLLTTAKQGFFQLVRFRFKGFPFYVGRLWYIFLRVYN